MTLAATKKSATKPRPERAGTKSGEKAGPNGGAAAGATGPGAKLPSSAPPVNGSASAAGNGAAKKGSDTVPQVASLVSKVIELADAGVKLGINLVSLLTSYATTQAGAMASVSQPPTAAPEAPSPPAAATDPGPSRSYCIVNRMPLHPGDPVKVSFSINNDMADAVKNLTLACRGFVGATQAYTIPDDLFSVEPASASIAPLDFERFVLKGTIVAEAPADSYNGWILVSGDEQLRIPAVLLVS